MGINSEYVKMFKDEYFDLKPDLSDLSITMIDTMFSFVKEDIKSEKKVFTKKEALEEVKKLSILIEQKHSNQLNNKLDILIQKIENNECYIDLLIKLECAVGIYPNNLFHKKTKNIFYNDVFKPIIWGNFEDEYLVQNQKGK